MSEHPALLFSLAVLFIASTAFYLFTFILPRRPERQYRLSLICIQYAFIASFIGYVGFVLRFYDQLIWSVVLTNAFLIGTFYLVYMGLVYRHIGSLAMGYIALMVAHIVLFCALQTLLAKHSHSEMLRDLFSLVNLVLPVSLIVKLERSQGDHSLLGKNMIIAAVTLFWICLLLIYPMFIKFYRPDVNQNIYFVALGLFSLQSLFFAGVACIQINELVAKLKDDSYTDSLTGLKNRLFLNRIAESLFSAARRYRFGNCLMVAELDELKSLKKRCGNPAGDEAIKRVAECLVGLVRKEDILIRIDCEDFLVLLPNISATKAKMVAERMIAAVQQCSFSANQQAVPLSISIGLSAIQDGDDLQAAIKRAEQAKMQAQKLGISQIQLAETQPYTDMAEPIVAH